MAKQPSSQASGTADTEYPEDWKIIHEELYVQDYRLQFKGNMNLSIKGNTEACLRR